MDGTTDDVRGRWVTAEQILLEIRRTLQGKDPEQPAVRRALRQIANRTGVAEILLDTLRRGEIGAAHVAAMALPFARSELVRRGLQRAVRTEAGERRAIYLAALTDKELETALSEMGESLAADLVHASGILAVNSPREFIELVCSGAPVVDERVIAHLEQVRESFGVGAASLYEPLLERRLTPEARRRAMAVLGREPGPAVQRLLDREQARDLADEDRRVLRRERMRQSSLGLSAAPPERHGGALISPLGTSEAVVLELVEALEDDRCLRTTVVIGARGGVDRFTVPVQGEVEQVLETIGSSFHWGRLELGQARTLLEGLARRQRDDVSSLLDRLSTVEPRELPWPAPEGELDPEAAHRLVREPMWSDWRPFARVLEWPEEALEATADVSFLAFPGDPHLTAGQAAVLAPAVLQQRGVASRLATGLRHMALVMSLRGDPRAGAVASAAAFAARRRAGALVSALAERELWLQLWTHGRLPRAYREAVRSVLRERFGAAPPRWEDVQRLDLAQAAAEGLARAVGEARQDKGLPSPELLDLDLAFELADRARETFADPALRRKVRGGRFELVAEAARGWLAQAPPQVAFELAQLLATTCFAGCPHRCFGMRPHGRAADVFAGENPRDVDAPLE